MTAVSEKGKVSREDMLGMTLGYLWVQPNGCVQKAVEHYEVWGAWE